VHAGRDVADAAGAVVVRISGLAVARGRHPRDAGDDAESRRDLVVQVELKQVDMIDDRVVQFLTLLLVVGADVVAEGVVDAIAGGDGEPVEDAGAVGVAGVGLGAGIEPGDERLRGVRGDASLGACNRVHAEQRYEESSGD
jgi:hypothetical protein